MCRLVLVFLGKLLWNVTTSIMISTSKSFLEFFYTLIKLNKAQTQWNFLSDNTNAKGNTNHLKKNTGRKSQKLKNF